MQDDYTGCPASTGFLFPGRFAPPTWAPMANRRPYDLPHVMSELPEYLRNWVHAISLQLDVDRGMALSTLLSGMGSAVQGAWMVNRPDGGFEPLACFSIVLGGPTTGKTRTHRIVHQAHDAHDIVRYEDYRAAGRSRNKNRDDASSSPAKAPRLRSVILQDASKRGLLEALDGVCESTAISVDEGQQVLEGALFRRHLATLNGLHDGKGKAMITRGKGDVVVAHDASLTVLIMVQPDIFEAYLEKYGETARGIGFLARCLVTTTPLFRDLQHSIFQPPEGCLATYHAKVSSFLKARLAQLEAGNTQPSAIHFSPGAAQLWLELSAEQRHLAGAAYWHVQDAANRAMQNVARIAGIIHCYDDADGEISSEALKAAWAIVQWNLDQFARLFPPKPLPPAPKPTTQEKQQRRECEDCQTILNCIAEACSRSRESDAMKSKVFIRSGLYNARFRTALMRLIDEGLVLESGEGQQARLSIVPLREIPPMHPGPYERLAHASL